MSPERIRQRTIEIAARNGLPPSVSILESLVSQAMEELEAIEFSNRQRQQSGRPTISTTSNNTVFSTSFSSFQNTVRSSLDSFNEVITQTTNNNNRNMRPDTQLVEELTEKMKSKHLRKEERNAIHRPLSDYYEGSRGEECKNACSLEVEDLVLKFKV